NNYSNPTTPTNGTVLITDFTAGANGDRIQLYDFLNSGQSIGYTNSTIGYLRLIQNGNDALFQWDKDGASSSTYGWVTLLTLQNLNLINTPLTADNFSPSSSIITTLGGAEDSTIAINLSSSTNIASFKITSLPNGALYSDSGLTQALNVNSLVPATSNAATVYFRPTANWSGTTSLQYSTIDAQSVESVIGTTTTLTVLGVADAPTLTVSNVTGNGSIPLSISAALTDTDGSELLDITVAGVPQSTASLSAGNYNVNNDGLWHLTSSQLANLTLSTSQTSGSIALTVNAVSKEIANPSSTAMTTKTLTISLGGVANQAPILTTPYFDQGISYGKQWSFPLANHFTDPDSSALTYSIANHAWLSVSGDTLVGIPPSKALNQTIPVQITATDSNLSATANFTVTVLDFDAGNLFLSTSATETITGSASGIDTVSYKNSLSSVSVSLAAGTVSGGDGNDTLVGIENVIGSNYADTFIDNSSINNSTLSGGLGNDVYVTANSTTKIIENFNGGFDEVQSGVDYDLSKLKNVEKLTLTGNAIKAVGANKNELLVGNSANNILDGRASADTMQGGAGNDTYYVDNVGDVIYEDSAHGGSGTDTVISSITSLSGYTLPIGVENLTLIGKSSRSVMQGSGNELNNVITASAGGGTLNGFSGDDTLNGGNKNDKLFGGLGADYLVGGAGKNVYIYKFANDSTVSCRDQIFGTFDGGTVDKIQLASTLSASDLNIISAQSAGVAASGLTVNALNTLLSGTGATKFQSSKLNVAILNTTDSKTFFAIDIDGDGAFTSGDMLMDVTGSALTSVTASTFKVTAPVVANSPTATNLTASETYIEDTPLNLTDIVITDIDSQNVTATLTLSNPAAGSLNITTSNAVTSTYNATTGVWSASGAVTDVNTLLAGLTFTPAANFNGNFTVATSVSDGVTTAITGTKSFTGTAVNDAPTFFTANALSVANGSIITSSGDVTTTQPTLEADVYWDGTGVNPLLIYNGNPGNSGYGLLGVKNVTNGTLEIHLLIGGKQVVPTVLGTIQANSWTHMGVSLAADNTTYNYAIGSTVSSISSLSPNTQDSTIRFGGINGDSFSGQVDNIAVWNTALTGAEIASHTGTLVGNEANLAGLWKFENNFTNNVSGGHAFATTTGSTSFTSAFAISGIAIKNQTLTVDTSSIHDADGLGSGGFNYQWKKTINGTTTDIVLQQNQSSLPLTDAEVGAQISVVVTYTDSGGTLETLTTPLTSIVQSTTVAVTAANVSPYYDASVGNIQFNFTSGTSDYTYTIANFGAGDVLTVPVGNEPTITNSSGSDGIVDFSYALNSQVITVHLTGLTAQQDAAIFSLSSFRTVFGANSVTAPLLSMGTTSFDFSTDPAANFSKSGSAFSWSSVNGEVTIPSPSDEIWTLNQAAPVTVNNDTYTVSAFIYNGSGNSGYAALGFSTNSINSSTNNGVIGSSASPVANSFLGVSFHGGSGNFLNDGIDATNLNHAQLSANAWYKVVFSARETSSTTFDLTLDIYDASSSSVAGSSRYHTTMAVTNSNIASSAGLYPYFANEGSRLDSIDNFEVVLSYTITNFLTAAAGLANGSATVDVTGATSQQITDLISNISKVSTGGLTGSISLTAAQFTALEAALNSSATLTVTDTSIAATALIAMDAKSLNPVNATAVTTITGLVGDIASMTDAMGNAGNKILLPSLTTLNPTDAIIATTFDNTVFTQSPVTINLANVANNALTIASATIGAGNTLNVIGSALTGTNALTFNGSAETDGKFSIVGGASTDTITGGAGSDTITGGLGSDVFKFLTAPTNGKDTITDFVSGIGGDVLDVTAFDPTAHFNLYSWYPGNIALITVNTDGTIDSNTDLAATGSAILTPRQPYNHSITVVNVVGTAIAAKDYSAANFGDIFGSSAKAFSTTAQTAGGNDKAVILVEGTDQTQVYFAQDTHTNGTWEASDLTLVAVLTGTNNTGATWNATNFLPNVIG
ncbi:MAG: type I secretion C-terminal target domain-containing protein, partial [Methylococcales bacterium]|nr:type I secretion C-terminal target domain-containing protein [Methylococcales bacterium]